MNNDTPEDELLKATLKGIGPVKFVDIGGELRNHPIMKTFQRSPIVWVPSLENYTINPIYRVGFEDYDVEPDIIVENGEVKQCR